jgi:hypothetical protein
MQRLDLVLQAKVYVNQAKQTVSRPHKARLLKIAQRLLSISAEGTAGVSLISPFEPRYPQVRRALVPVSKQP